MMNTYMGGCPSQTLRNASSNPSLSKTLLKNLNRPGKTCFGNYTSLRGPDGQRRQALRHSGCTRRTGGVGRAGRAHVISRLLDFLEGKMEIPLLGSFSRHCELLMGDDEQSYPNSYSFFSSSSTSSSSPSSSFLDCHCWCACALGPDVKPV